MKIWLKNGEFEWNLVMLKWNNLIRNLIDFWWDFIKIPWKSKNVKAQSEKVILPGATVHISRNIFAKIIFWKYFKNFLQNRQHAKRLCFPRVNGVLFSPKSLKSQKLPAEVDFLHFCAKVSKYCPIKRYFSSKWSQMAKKCTFGAKVPFGAIPVPGRVQKPQRLSLLSARGAKFAHFS